MLTLALSGNPIAIIEYQQVNIIRLINDNAALINEAKVNKKLMFREKVNLENCPFSRN